MQLVGFGRGHFGEYFTSSRRSWGTFQSLGSSVTERLEERITKLFWKEAGRKWECNFLLRTLRLDPCSIFL